MLTSLRSPCRAAAIAAVLSLLFRVPAAAAEGPVESPPRAEPATTSSAPQRAGAEQAGCAGAADAEFARLHAEIAVLNKAVASLLEAEAHKRKQAAWLAVREEEARSYRTGPPIGLLVGGGVLMATGVGLLAANDDFIMPGATILAVGGLMAAAGAVTLTRVVRKRRAIRREALLRSSPP